MGLTNRQEQIIIGSILGDGHLELNGRNVRLRVDHSQRQKEYLFWKYRELRDICPSEPRIVKILPHYKTKKVYERWHFSTFSSADLNRFRETFYISRRKIIPICIKQILKDPLSLAVWFMDDGYKRNDCNAFRLHTDCYSLDEQKLLQNCLKENFCIGSSLHKKGDTWNIYIPSAQSERFRQVIGPFILPDMRYKLPLAP